MEVKSRTRTKKMIMCAMLTALTAVFAQISINLPGGVPISFGLLAVFLSGAILGAKGGAVSQIIYALLGLIGAPVFQGFTGGASILFGKTGGYILGYIVASFITGFIVNKFGKEIYVYVIGMVIGLLGCYILGTAWFMFLTKLGLRQSLIYCVIPFIPLDLLKAIVATILAKNLQKVIKL